MDNNKESLQRFTETEEKINKIFTLKKITNNDLNILTPLERRRFVDVLTEKLNAGKGADYDEVLQQADEIITPSTKNQLWESNHLTITVAISKLMQDYGCMPTKNNLAAETGLSRVTINKHIRGYNSHPLYLKELEQFRFMSSKILAKVFKYAVNGDMKAARLYFDMIGSRNEQSGNGTHIQQQNNFIQINETVLSQENIKQLNPEQLAQIEGVIKLTLPEINKKHCLQTKNLI
ncbi:hypothetical protein [Mucilaginibacter sp. L196]|uniref:hypothetical protein n=1 Tax=Mucilaginibacter sp. L196 TaxID=1641870 RepID=UPI00131B9FD5|nr:hypothetical protein [Mucilaginibacter sp. L196]